MLARTEPAERATVDKNYALLQPQLAICYRPFQESLAFVIDLWVTLRSTPGFRLALVSRSSIVTAVA
jgi:hypothetical protein